MQTATVRVLRNEFARVSQWIERGESVRITKSGKAFAILQPLRRGRKSGLEWPDFAKRIRAETSEPDGNAEPDSASH